MASEAMPHLAMSVGFEYSQVLYLDNDSSQIRLIGSTHPRIESIHIPESTDTKSQPLAHIISRLESISGHDFTGNTYLERAFHIRARRPQHNYDPLSGIQEKHTEQVDNWMSRTSTSQNRALLMDWDRTISLFEGYFGDDEGSLPADHLAYYEDLLLVLLGGAMRLEMIRKMAARAQAAGIEMYVITNNGGCNDPSSGFNNFVTQLFGSIPYTMICGRDFGGHKGRALQSDPRFNKMKEHKLRLSIGGGSHRNGRLTRRNRHTRRRQRNLRNEGRTIRFHRRRRALV
jgi:hypothetical protein